MLQSKAVLIAQDHSAKEVIGCLFLRRNPSDQLLSDTIKQNKHVESFRRICLDTGSNPVTSTKEAVSKIPGFGTAFYYLCLASSVRVTSFSEYPFACNKTR
jgi:hypothetical protein